MSNVTELFRYPLLTLARVAVVLMGSTVAYFSIDGYFKLRKKPMLFMSIGFVLLSASMVIQGLVFELSLGSVFSAIYVQTVIMALGMIAVLYSLFCRE